MQGARAGRRRVLAHLLQGPGQVDGGGPRGGQRRRGGVEVLAARGGERESVCGCDADGGRAANGKLADRGYQLADGRALQLDDLVREPTLVEEDDPRALLLVPNDVFGV